MTIEPHSETWLTVKATAEKTISSGRDELASEGIDQRAADVIRGRIAFAKAVLELANPPAALVETDPLYT